MFSSFLDHLLENVTKYYSILIVKFYIVVNNIHAFEEILDFFFNEFSIFGTNYI